MYQITMFGTTGNYVTEYNTKKQAEKAADNIRLLGYEVSIALAAEQKRSD